MTITDIFILIAVGLIIGAWIYRLFKKKSGCSSCAYHKKITKHHKGE